MPVVFNRQYAVSIIVPTYNEEPNIVNLVRRIDDSLRNAGLKYELIFIDDNSLDGTQKQIQALKDLYPIRLFTKDGRKGKAFSLLQGFSYARYRYIVMLDADLQYPPEAIPAMLGLIINKYANIVVANRALHKTSKLRQLASNVNRTLFCELMWGLNHDVQSGLKVFEKSVLEDISINPSPWTFDLEFLVKTRSKGAVIKSYDIEFAAREAGVTKINLLYASQQIILSSVKLKIISYKNGTHKRRSIMAGLKNND